MWTTLSSFMSVWCLLKIPVNWADYSYVFISFYVNYFRIVILIIVFYRKLFKKFFICFISFYIACFNISTFRASLTNSMVIWRLREVSVNGASNYYTLFRFFINYLIVVIIISVCFFKIFYFFF